MQSVLVIGAGGVSHVTVHKMASLPFYEQLHDLHRLHQ